VLLRRNPAVAHTGEVIVNPVTGERMTSLHTAADTNGQMLCANVTVALSPVDPRLLMGHVLALEWRKAA
jgi:hypothetical protein